MASDKLRVVGIDDDNVELGIHNGVESYDQDSGRLYSTATIPLKDLEEAVSQAHKDRKVREKATKAAAGDAAGFAPKIHPSDPSADSSFRSEDRPPILISSDTAPEPAAPLPLEETTKTAAGVERQPSGLADVIGNRQFDKAPGPNIAQPPEGVAQPKPDPDAPSAYPSLAAAADGSQPTTSDTGADPKPVKPASSRSRSRSKASTSSTSGGKVATAPKG